MISSEDLDYGKLAINAGLGPIHSLAFAEYLDAKDDLRHLRQHFNIPQHDGQDSVYACGNSLGAQPKLAVQQVQEELEVWSKSGVDGHFDHPKGRPWKDVDEASCKLLVPLVGAASSDEIACMGNLSTNLHLLMAAFYRPTRERFKIMIEEAAFPSDYFIVESQARWHGLDPKEVIIKVAPRPGEELLRPEDILEAIRREGPSIAVIMFAGVQFMTGQVFDMVAITRAGHEHGCYVGFDLAHAVGNVPLSLHEWDVDFAAWCTYKYLNSGPGGISGIFVHNRHDRNEELRVLRGWWGHEGSTRFEMGHEFVAIPGARGYQHSNPNVLAMTCLHASLQVFHLTDIHAIRWKSRRLTEYFRALVADWKELEIVTPQGEAESGAQLTLKLPEGVSINAFMGAIKEHGLVCDARRNRVVRVAFTGMYNTFTDVLRTVQIIRAATSVE